MPGHVDSSLFVYSESGKIYLDDLVNNVHGCGVSPVSIDELRDNSATLLKDTEHVVVAAELGVIKEVLQYAISHHVNQPESQDDGDHSAWRGNAVKQLSFHLEFLFRAWFG